MNRRDVSGVLPFMKTVKWWGLESMLPEKAAKLACIDGTAWRAVSNSNQSDGLSQRQ
ncbi:hypothetical protein ACWWD9_10145 [Methylovorus sp. SPW-M1]